MTPRRSQWTLRRSMSSLSRCRCLHSIPFCLTGIVVSDQDLCCSCQLPWGKSLYCADHYNNSAACAYYLRPDMKVVQCLIALIWKNKRNKSCHFLPGQRVSLVMHFCRLAVEVSAILVRFCLLIGVAVFPSVTAQWASEDTLYMCWHLFSCHSETYGQSWLLVKHVPCVVSCSWFKPLQANFQTL